jgi:hypothetical protein
MLVIRREQLAALGEQCESDFRRRLLNHLIPLRTQYGRSLTDQELAKQMERGLTSGRRFFTSEIDLVRYVDIVMTRMGGWSDNDHPPKVMRLLEGRSLPGARRLDNLEHWLRRTGRVHA